MLKNGLFTSESVTAGHPDKACDQVSDAILDAYLQEDPFARVGCETMLKTVAGKGGFCILSGEVTSNAHVDPVAVAQRVLSEIGYTSAELDFDPLQATYLNILGTQSPDISIGVSEGQGLHQEQGAGDQGMMFGYACKETEQFMPASTYFAHRLTEQLTAVRKNGEIPWLRPDGKSQVTVEYVDGEPIRIDTIVISCQHTPEVPHSEQETAIIHKVIRPTIPAHLLDDKTIIHINPTGAFTIGGPLGDAGLTGRKIIVDTYGGHGSHGGGAFSGKDPSKVDRSAAYMARYVAKNIVAAGLAKRVLVQLAYAIGVAQPVSVSIQTFGTSDINEERIMSAVQKIFPLTPAGIIEKLNLRRPMYQPTAAFGHFGRPLFPWEETDMVQSLRNAIV
ncbi:MAG TPA: methionine adenosyltransferase [Patescibacteria group bacterium]|nr:methionine adenosyltransferase [Patescibacteria group bacterium]